MKNNIKSILIIIGAIIGLIFIGITLNWIILKIIFSNLDNPILPKQILYSLLFLVKYMWIIISVPVWAYISYKEKIKREKLTQFQISLRKGVKIYFFVLLILNGISFIDNLVNPPPEPFNTSQIPKLLALASPPN